MDLFIKLGGWIISVILFLYTTYDRIKKNAKETSKDLIEYRLNEYEKKLDEGFNKIYNKLDQFESEIDSKIEKAINVHIAMYHTRKKGEK